MVAEYVTAAVVQGAGTQSEGLGAGDFTVTVVDAFEVFEQQLPWRINKAIGVIQVPLVHVQGQFAVAVKLTGSALVKAGEAGVERLATGDTPLETVIYVGGCEVEALSAGDTALMLVKQYACGQLQCTVSHNAPLAVVDTARIYRRRISAEHLAVLIG